MACRSCTKFVKNDCRAAVEDVDPLAVEAAPVDAPPLRSPINLLKVLLSFDGTAPCSGLPDRFATSDCSALMIPCWPYALAPLFALAPLLVEVAAAAVSPLSLAALDWPAWPSALNRVCRNACRSCAKPGSEAVLLSDVAAAPAAVAPEVPPDKPAAWVRAFTKLATKLLALLLLLFELFVPLVLVALVVPVVLSDDTALELDATWWL